MHCAANIRRTVERVRQRAHQSPYTARRHARIRVQRHYKLIPPDNFRRYVALELAFTGKQQPVQRHQRAALAFMRHEAIVSVVKLASTL